HAHKVRSPQGLFESHVPDPGPVLHQPPGVPKIMNLLHGLDESIILIRRVVAQNIHVEPDTLLNEGLPDTAGPNYRHGLSGDLIPEKGQVRMPEAPLVLSRQM